MVKCLYTVLITIIITTNSTTAGFVGLCIIIGKLKIVLKKKDAMISSAAPRKEMRGTYWSPSSRRNWQILNLV